MPWHFIFESLAYAVAFRMYVASRARQGDFLSTNNRWTIVAAAIGGAALGAKVLFWFEDPARTLAHFDDFAYLMSGKTIVGALLGGTLAVEVTKRIVGIHRRTGDLFAVPLCIGIAIGRVGCYAAGLQDDTYGLPTQLPWVTISVTVFRAIQCKFMKVWRRSAWQLLCATSAFRPFATATASVCFCSLTAVGVL